MILIKKRQLVPKGYIGITIYPFVFYKEDKNLTKTFISHERIHLEQQKEMLVIFFYLFYGIEFLVRLIRTFDRDKAYYNLSFEREAYDNQASEDYLKVRKKFSWIKYYKKKNINKPKF